MISRPRDIRPDEERRGDDAAARRLLHRAPRSSSSTRRATCCNAWGGPGLSRQRLAASQATSTRSSWTRNGNVWISGQRPRRRHPEVHAATASSSGTSAIAARSPSRARRCRRCVENNQQTDVLPNGVFIFTLDEAAREIYLVEGKRVLVYDMDDGQLQARLGRPRHAAERDQQRADAAVRLEGGPPPEQQEFAAGAALRPYLGGRPGLRLRARHRTGSRSSPSRASSSPAFHVARVHAVTRTRMRRPR